MKTFFLTALLFFALYGGAQNRSAITYPVLANLNLSEAAGEALDANALRKGQAVRLSFTVINPNLSEAVKAGSCALQIQLGKKLRTAQRAAVAKMAFADYFSWSASTDEKGATLLSGKLVKNLPADFTGTVSVELHCAETGSSTVKAQWVDAAQAPIGSLSAVDVSVSKK